MYLPACREKYCQNFRDRRSHAKEKRDTAAERGNIDGTNR